MEQAFRSAYPVTMGFFYLHMAGVLRIILLSKDASEWRFRKNTHWVRSSFVYEDKVHRLDNQNDAARLFSQFGLVLHEAENL